MILTKAIEPALWRKISTASSTIRRYNVTFHRTRRVLPIIILSVNKHSEKCDNKSRSKASLEFSARIKPTNGFTIVTLVSLPYNTENRKGMIFYYTFGKETESEKDRDRINFFAYRYTDIVTSNGSHESKVPRCRRDPNMNILSFRKISFAR